VLRYAKTLESMGKKVSVIYGALPYDARKKQVELYRNGETDIVVATDAIGMGLNLPIKRIIFSASSKFDGRHMRSLKHYEIKQIAGRAGRRGIYDEGIVSVFTEGDVTLKEIELGLKTPYKPIEKIVIPFPEECIKENTKVSEVMRIWKKIQYPSIFEPENLNDRLVKVQYIEGLPWFFDTATILALSKVVFDTENEGLFDMYKFMIKNYQLGKFNKLPSIEQCRTLSEYEQFHKKLQLYYSFHNSLGIDIDINKLNELKNELIERINKKLEEEKGSKSVNRCRLCNCELPPFFKFTICKDCYGSWY
jgi:ATP-dependent RNA helicase SUPV3L1/SUV3